jgi:predicted MPP superfamily phosphohydrolase
MSCKVVKTEYKISLPGVKMRIAVAADLHNSSWDDIIPVIKESRPDIIVCPGDTFGSFDGGSTPAGELTGRYIEEAAENETGVAFLRAAAKIAPVYVSVGNHEVRVSDANAKKIAGAGAVLLDNSYTTLKNGVILGGLTTGGAHGLMHKSLDPDVSCIKKFAALKGPKILLCHHPEYWERYITGEHIDLTVAGHAHGGQWRFFGRGVLAPGQGFFPKYTSGMHEKEGSRLIVSRGLRKECGVPRINNPIEIVIINIE